MCCIISYPQCLIFSSAGTLQLLFGVTCAITSPNVGRIFRNMSQILSTIFLLYLRTVKMISVHTRGLELSQNSKQYINKTAVVNCEIIVIIIVRYVNKLWIIKHSFPGVRHSNFCFQILQAKFIMSSLTCGGPPDHNDTLLVPALDHYDALDPETDHKDNLHAAAAVQNNVVNDQETRNSTVDGENSVASGARGNQCDQCKKTFKKTNNFKAHCRNKASGPRKCVKCAQYFCTKKQLQKHKQNKHPFFKCTRCGKSFSHRIRLEKHEYIRYRKKTSCAQCTKIFCTTNELKLHNEACHCGSDIHSEKVDTSAKSAMRGFVSQSDINRERKTCPICRKMFLNWSKVRRHIKTEHERIDRLSCEKCNKSYSCKASLDYHIRSKHNEDNLHQCEMCGESFESPEDVAKHKKSQIN